MRCALLPGGLLAGACCCTDASVLCPTYSRVVRIFPLLPGKTLPVVIAGENERADASVLCTFLSPHSGVRFFPLLPDGSVPDVIADGVRQSE